MLKNITKTHPIDTKETKNLLLFSIGKFISVFGSAIYAFAIGLYVLNTTGSGLSFAATLTFSILPVVIFGPFSGVIADRLDKKKTIVLMDTLNAVLFSILFVLSHFGTISLIVIFISTFVSTTLTTVFNTCFESAKPHLVSDEKLININSSGRIIDSSSSVLAPLLGGMIFALIDLKLFMLFNAVSFLFSAILEYFIDFNYNKKAAEQQKNKQVDFKNDMLEGLQFILKRNDIKKIVGVLIAINFFLGIGATVPIPYIINNVLGLSTRSFGIIEGAFPVGIILGALLVKKVINRFSHHSIMKFTAYMMALCTILGGIPLVLKSTFSESVYLIYYVMDMLIFGITLSLVDIPIMFKLQKTVEDAYRGRVLSIGVSLAKVVQPLSFMISGLLLGTINPAYLVFAGGSMLLFSILLILNRSSKKADI